MSGLEAYRKQAKQLVRWHRQGHSTVGGRIRGLPRYAHLTDAQALKLEFPLAAAQEIIARESGFENWAALKIAVIAEAQEPRSAIQEMPKEATELGQAAAPETIGNGHGVSRDATAPVRVDGRPAIKAAIPVIFVASVASAAGFFHDQLGFSIDFLHGQPPFYGAVSRNGVMLHLRFVHEPLISPELRQREQLLAAFIAVENIKGLFEEYKMKGVPFVATLHKEPWGGPTFTVLDPDGNWLCFCAAT